MLSHGYFFMHDVGYFFMPVVTIGIRDDVRARFRNYFHKLVRYYRPDLAHVTTLIGWCLVMVKTVWISTWSFWRIEVV